MHQKLYPYGQRIHFEDERAFSEAERKLRELIFDCFIEPGIATASQREMILNHDISLPFQIEEIALMPGLNEGLEMVHHTAKLLKTRTRTDLVPRDIAEFNATMRQYLNREKLDILRQNLLGTGMTAADAMEKIERYKAIIGAATQLALSDRRIEPAAIERIVENQTQL